MIERALERFLFASRWLLAPFYAGLVIALVVLLLKALQELPTSSPTSRRRPSRT